ncbi:MAG TPA: aminotransferase class IV [Rariglobus sp.]|jgi:branched-subunit amino acid aminotransferase/4-amino-4-deoxychorismate lyase|nr:aminotransferase class IV [Rariglobus sp.]
MSLVDHKVMQNGKLRSGHSVKISPLNEGFLYGHGLFETIKIVSGRPAFLSAHHARLTTSAHALDLPYQLPLDELRERLLTLSKANDLKNGSAKVTLFNDGDFLGELITVRAFTYSPETYARGFRLKTRPTGRRIAGLTGHKTLNYLENIRARRAAIAAGFDETLFIDTTGEAIEGAGTNLFIVRDGVALTPPLSSGPLPGIARAQVLALLSPNRAREAVITAADLHTANEAFVTNALLGVMPVALIDTHTFPTVPGPFTGELQTTYRTREARTL